MKKKNKTKKPLPWKLILAVSVVSLVIAPVGCALTFVQIFSDQYTMAQGEGAMTAQELATQISDKRNPQFVFFTVLGVFSIILLIISGVMSKRLRNLENSTIRPTEP